ncbi:hypothetical protein ACFQV2_27740 [Actinokineospora soli]|uniref:Immunity protein 53 n=1 Tax=Actinokineospora soli TaxID=1048753 RepID=A0ABW2TU04_9PSEU
MDALDALTRLTRAGWVFTYPRDDTGGIIAGYAVRLWPGGWWDGLILHAEHECEAIRVDPDNALTWRRDGTVVDMVAAVAELPAPGERLAPSLATGSHFSGFTNF